MLNYNIPSFESDTRYTQGFLDKPFPMLVDKMPSGESWVLEQALEVALTMEEGNFRLYSDAQEEVSDPGARQLLKELAEDVLWHEEHMKSVYDGLLGVVSDKRGNNVERVMDLGVTDSLRAEPLGRNDTYQDVLIFAARREKIGYDFFSMQAGGVKDDSQRRIWEDLAALKLVQKLKIESEYDDVVLRDN